MKEVWGLGLRVQVCMGKIMSQVLLLFGRTVRSQAIGRQVWVKLGLTTVLLVG